MTRTRTFVLPTMLLAILAISCRDQLPTEPMTAATRPTGTRMASVAVSQVAFSQTATQGSLGNDNSIGVAAWDLSPSAGGVFAKAILNDQATNGLQVTNFSFHIPTDAFIWGIAVQVQRNATGEVWDNGVRLLRNGVPVGADRSAGSCWRASGQPDCASTDAILYGDSTNVWGTGWTPADINASGFGLELAARGAGTPSVRGIQITIFYTTSETFSQVNGPGRAGAGGSFSGSLPWSNPEAITTGDYYNGSLLGDIAEARGGDAFTTALSEELQASSFGFTIPLNADVSGIQVKVWKRAGVDEPGEVHWLPTSRVSDHHARLLNHGALGGADKASSDAWQAPWSDDAVTYGGPSDLWGRTWTPADINDDNFGFSLQAEIAAHFLETAVAAVDYVEVTVFYTGKHPSPATTTTLTTTNVSLIGQPVALTATVLSQAGIPAGTVTFFEGASQLGSAILVDGTATLSVSTLTLGSHTISASYSGAAPFLPSSTSATHEVEQGTTTTTIVGAVNPSEYGQTPSFTVTVAPVAPGAGTPTGKVHLELDGTVLVFGYRGVDLGLVTLQNGQVTGQFPANLAVGNHTIEAVYEGSGDFALSYVTYTQVVKPYTVGAVLVSSVNPSVVGQPTVFTAHLTGAESASATGHVEFWGPFLAYFGQANVVNGSASLSKSNFPAGSWSVFAIYYGDATHSHATSATLTQVVNKSATTTGVTTGASPSIYGATSPFTVTIAAVAPGAGMPTGTVQMTVDGTALPNATLSNGSVTGPDLSTLAAGTHVIVATYGGDLTFKPSTATATQVVQGAPTTASIMSSNNPSSYGLTQPLTIRVAAVNATLGTPTGKVHMTVDGNALPDATLVNGEMMSPDISLLSPGDHAIAVNYTGDSHFAPGTASYTQTVALNTPTVTMTSSLNPAAYQEPVTLTVTLSGYGAATPVGTVQIMEGSSSVTPPTPLVNGSAQVDYCCRLAGTHALTAVFTGDQVTFGTSSSPLLTETVAPAATSTTLVSALNPAIIGQAVLFTATVNNVGSLARGLMQWSVDGTNVGTSPVGAGSSATLSLNTLAIGGHQVVANYQGDANHAGSASAALAQQVNPPPNSAPIVNAGGPYAGNEGALIPFNASGSSDADGDPLTYDWTFGDGTAAVNAGPTPSHAYVTNGSYAATVTVRDDHDHMSLASVTVNVANVPPAVSAIASVQILAGEQYSLAGSFTDPGADTYSASVNWGDGASEVLSLTGNAFNATHKYPAAGTFTVTVSVRDNDGGVGTSAATVTALSPEGGAQQLVHDIQQLLSSGHINSQTAKRLSVPADAAVTSLAKGRPLVADVALAAFVVEVRVGMKTGKIPAADGAALIDLAQRVLRNRVAARAGH